MILFPRGRLTAGLIVALLSNVSVPAPALAQTAPRLPRLPSGETIPLPPADETILEEQIPDTPLPSDPLPTLPDPDELLAPVNPSGPGEDLNDADATFFVDDIQIQGSTVFTAADFADLIAPYVDRQVSFNELLQLRTAITERYVEAGYLTSGALIPPQTLVDNVVILQVIEGELEDIVITGTTRLNEGYVRSRIERVATPPLQVENLLAGLQRLQLDPLIETVAADLQAGVRPGTSLLVLDITEAESFDVTTRLANNRSPNIGGTQRTLGISEGNLFGLGDKISFDYKNTDGSDGFDLSYTLPISANNDTLRLAAGYSSSQVINSVFSVLEISSDSYYYELGWRHPFIETPTTDLAVGLTLSHQRSQTRLGLDNIGPFPLSPGADDNGSTRVTALRFFQEWTQRSEQHVLALRSQFNLGVGALGATVNDIGPDSRFLSWRGQGQWVQSLGSDTLFFLRGDAQLALNDLLSAEEFGLGGAQSVRGYRQDALLRDNGTLLSAELRLPIARVPELDGVLQVIPFIDAGVAWNFDGSSTGPNTLVGAGLGLLWQQGNDFSARLDWGIPLVDLAGERSGWQDNGIYFSIQYTPF
ncbi:MAG: ShlB/FhaC/HecB family hemolysin secretion/activation protein [Cyanobacteria bacterium J06632_22]